MKIERENTNLKKRCAGAVWYALGCDMTGGADPAQPTYQSPNHCCPKVHDTPSLVGIGTTLDTHAGHDMRGRFRHFSGGTIQVGRHMVPHRRHGTWSRRLTGTGSAVGLSEQ